MTCFTGNVKSGSRVQKWRYRIICSCFDERVRVKIGNILVDGVIGHGHGELLDELIRLRCQHIIGDLMHVFIRGLRNCWNMVLKNVLCALLGIEPRNIPRESHF